MPEETNVGKISLVRVMPCNHKTVGRLFYSPFIVPDSSQANLLKGVLKRVLTPTRESAVDWLLHLRNIVDFEFYHWTKGVTPWADLTTRNFINKRYSGARKAALLEALDTKDQLSRIDMKQKGFVKVEKVGEKRDFHRQDPRVIHARTDRYLVNLMQFIKPLEDVIYDLHRPRCKRRRLHLCKKLNPLQRGAKLREAWDRYENPIAIMADGKRFDQHVTKDAMRLLEHWLYLKVFHRDKVLRKLLRAQLKLDATGSGLKWSRDGGRGSGDSNTAIGNIILMSVFYMGALRRIGVDDYDLFDDGDDTVLICSGDYRAWLIEMLPGAFDGTGQNVEVEPPVHIFEQIDFCQSRPVLTVNGWCMVRNPSKSIGCFGLSHKWYSGEKLFRRYIRTLGKCEEGLHLGVPVLQEYSRMLLRNGAGDLLGEVAREYRYKGVFQGETRITLDSRNSFASAFGIPIPQQLAWENYLAELELVWVHGATIHSILPGF